MIITARGIQLIELVMVIAIIVILAAFSPFDWRHLFARTNDAILLSEMLQTIQTAQSEAQARGIAVALCQSKHQPSCSGNCLDGFMVFMNEHQDGKLRNANEIVSMVKPSLKEGHIYFRSFPRYRSYLLFQPHIDATHDNSTFWYCRSSKDKPAWAIVVNSAGRIRAVYPDKSGLIKDAKQQVLFCDEPPSRE